MVSLLTGGGQEVADSEAASWPDEFTREEMIEQQNILLLEECRMLQEDLTRYRQHLAKVIDMHASVTIERDELAAAVKKMTAEISRQNIQGSEYWRQIDSMKRVLHQRETVMRQYGVPEHYFGAQN